MADRIVLLDPEVGPESADVLKNMFFDSVLAIVPALYSCFYHAADDRMGLPIASVIYLGLILVVFRLV